MVEHGFSAMKHIKSDWRNHLNEETLDNLLRISIDGPPLSGFDPQVAVEQFLSKYINKHNKVLYRIFWPRGEIG